MAKFANDTYGLVGEWTFNSTVTPAPKSFWISFLDSTYTVLPGNIYSTGDNDLVCIDMNGNEYLIYSDGWLLDDFRTIYILDTDSISSPSLEDPEFATWLKANAVKTPAKPALPKDEVGIVYNNSVIASIKAGQKATIECEGVKMLTDIEVNVPEVGNKAKPIEVSTEVEMIALLESGEIGGVYKYIGETTDFLENGALYVLLEESE